MDLTSKEDSDYVKIYVNGLLHLHFLRKYYRGMSSYNNGVYTIELALQDQNITLEYHKREHWEAMLGVLDDLL